MIGIPHLGDSYEVKSFQYIFLQKVDYRQKSFSPHAPESRFWGQLVQ
jgi:outer membrane protein assembly factor BamE (lipoprotein component of BamABCDE complex)